MHIETEQIFSELNNGKEWRIDGDWRGKDLISVEQLTKSDVEQVFLMADHLEELSRLERREILADKRAVVLFYQPSTRTYGSFIIAAQDLGVNVLGIHEMNAYSSSVKGETLADTVGTVQAMGADLIVLRHPDDSSSLVAAKAANIPVISGGAGKLEHPTQALLDMRTIIKEANKPVADLTVAFVGDLKYGRTVHSLAKLLAIWGNRQMVMVADEAVRMPRGLNQWLEERGVSIYESDDLREVIGLADVIYDTRVQKEWFESNEEYLRVSQAMQITPEVMELAKKEAILMHPLPRVDEITKEVDLDLRAKYFDQVGHGVWVRGALMCLILLR